MNLTDYSCSEFMDMLSSGAPVPGGGSVAAMSGAFGASLVAMVARLSLGRDKYDDYELENKEILEIADHLSRELLSAANADSLAYEKVSDAYKMPKKTDEEKKRRSLAIETALKNASLIPFGVMEFCLRAVMVASKAVGKTNTNAVSDLGTATLCLRTALEGAWLNVLTNISSISDREFAEEYEKRGQIIMDEALPLMDDIYTAVFETIKGS